MIFEWDNYKNDLLSVFVIIREGLAIYGGVLGGVAVALIYCKVKRTSKPLHTVVGTNGYQLWITTAYYPSSEKWLDDLKTRREECTIIKLMIIEYTVSPPSKLFYIVFGGGDILLPHSLYLLIFSL